MSAGFTLSTTSRPDGGWGEEQGPGGPGTAGPHQPGWTGSSYLDGAEAPCPLPSPQSFIRPLATQAWVWALCSARPASRTRLRDSFSVQPEAGQCCPQNTVVSCHPKRVLQGVCSGCQDGLVTEMVGANHPGCLGPRRFLGYETSSADAGMIGHPTRRTGSGDCPHLQSHQIQIRPLCGFFPCLFIVITIHIM